MGLKRVTITGADDTTSIDWMLDITAEFPFVEWGILVSRNNTGTPRWPSEEWQVRAMQESHRMDFSMHVCGSLVRKALMGGWFVESPIADVAKRVQINTHAEPHEASVKFLDLMARKAKYQFIIQLDAVNDHLLYAAHWKGINAVGLFDGSHGAGILPNSWPQAIPGINCGYAGGLGPGNLADQLPRISQMAVGNWWVDMERNVRTLDDCLLDTCKVRRSLEACQPFIDKGF